MTEQQDEGRSIAEDGTQQSPQGPVGGGDGGRSSYGPSTTVGGEQDPGGAAPPYDDKKETASADPGPDAVRRDGAYVGGATAPTETHEGLTSPDPSDTPGGRTASPADEMPATESTGDERPQEDPGVGPAHVPGTGRAENKPDNRKG